MNNIHLNHWQLKGFNATKAGSSFIIEGIGHSDGMPQNPVLSIAGLHIPLQLNQSESPLVGLRLGNVTHWSFIKEIDSLLLPATEIQINILANGANFLPIVWYSTIESVPNVPNLQNIKRVGGDKANKHTHLNNGRKDFYRFDELIGIHKIPESKVIKLLDWGIGCGRVARHFISKSGFSVCGLDIDSFNIEWLNNHLQQIDARVCSVNPPTTFDDNEFDAVISFSVLSHLTPPNWLSWLKELHRLTKPGSLLMLSFHGDHSAGVYFGEHHNMYQEIFNEGFRDHGGRTEIGENYKDYYRDVFYSDAYATELFAKYFDVIEIVPGFVSGFQSIAVLRRKEPNRGGLFAKILHYLRD